LFINQILDGLKNIHKPQRKFLEVFFVTMFVCQSAINFSALARNSRINERTFRRQFRKELNFTGINELIVNQSECLIEAFAMDASFIKKSGKKTFGLDKFWNGCHGRAEKGLEASIISLIDSKQNASFAWSARQTAPEPETNESGKTGCSRIDFYGEQLEKTASSILKYTRQGVFDGYYAKRKFIDKTVDLGFEVISRLRLDANLKYLYQGAQKSRGARKKYDGKVDFSDLSRLQREPLKLQKKQIELFSGLVFSPRLKRVIKLVVVKYGKRSVNLFSTDVNLSAEKILQLYRSRFTIEFLIRDAKQSAGLETCEARDNKAIEFHWNASLTTVNLGRGIAQKTKVEEAGKPFSMKSIKQRFFNEYLLKMFISNLEFEQSLIKYQDAYEKLRSFAVIQT
jgi:hypothetical protein